MGLLSKQQINKDGLNPTLASAAAAGDTFENSGKEFLYVENTDASGHNVTVTAQVDSFNDGVYGEVDLSDVVVTVPAGEFRVFGPFAPAAFNNSDGEAEISYDSETGLQLAVLQLKG